MPMPVLLIDLIIGILFFVGGCCWCPTVRSICGCLFLVGFSIRIFLLSMYGALGFVSRFNRISIFIVFPNLLLIILIAS